MANYRIADITVEMQPRYALLKNRAELFREDDALTPDLKVLFSDESLAVKQQANPNHSAEQIEYLFTGAKLAGKLWHVDATMIHASAIEVDGRAYVFSGDSGVGKTTHTKRWLERFGDRARLINDDKPIIRKRPTGFFVYGSPFSGTCDENFQLCAPLAAIIFLKQAHRDEVYRLNAADAVKRLAQQCGISRFPRAATARLELFAQLIETVPIGEMGCTLSEHAVDAAYQWIEENRL